MCITDRSLTYRSISVNLSNLKSWKPNFDSLIPKFEGIQNVQAVRGAHKQVFEVQDKDNKKSFVIKGQPCSRQISLIAASDM